MNKDYCPNSPSGRHSLGGTFSTVTYKAEFEPIEYGATAEDTRYRRVEYMLSTCLCGYSQKKKVEIIHE